VNKTTFVCTHCGERYAVTIAPLIASKRETLIKGVPSIAARFKASGRHVFQSTAYPVYQRRDSGEFVEIDRESGQPKKKSGKPQPIEQYEEPARAPTIESDVSVPLRQALITGALGCVICTGLWFLAEGTKPGIVGGISLAVITYIDWLKNRGELRRLMWRIEKVFGDIDQDGYKGQPPPQPPGRTVINQQRPPMPESWQLLSAELRVMDVYHFAQIVWSRQQSGIKSNGQKALRGLPLPSGFELNDNIHGWMLQDLRDAGVIRQNGNSWELGAPPAAVKNRIRAEDW
jgi:hypothetical protein